MKLNLHLDDNINSMRFCPRFYLLFCIGIVLLMFSIHAKAQLKIEVKDGFQGGAPIAVLPFTNNALIKAPSGRSLHEIVQRDLSYTGLFSIVSGNVQELAMGEVPDYVQWLNNGVEKLVLGKIEQLGEQYEVKFELYDTIQRKRLSGQIITTRSHDKAAHFVSDAIYTQLTGFGGLFQTQIAFIGVEHFGWRKHKFTLYIGDIDGYNAVSIFSTAAQLMSPVWSPDMKRIAYVSYEDGPPEIIIQTLANAKREKTAKWIGSAASPDWSPDGKLAYVSSAYGNPEIYIADVDKQTVTRLTDNEAVDTEPSWTATGNIVFTSDRSGTPQLYHLNVKTGATERITHTGTYNSDADVSPLSNTLTFLSRRGNRYVVVYKDLSTGKERALIDAHNLERPRFIASGGIIGYLNDQGLFGLVTLDGISGDKISAPIQGRMRGISWSPLINKQ